MTKEELYGEYARLESELNDCRAYSTALVNINARLKEEVRCYEYYFEHREKVVHCRDCKHNGLYTCPIRVSHNPDFWCAKGELKED